MYCNCNNPLMLTIDHKKARVNGGTDKEENLQVTCFVCNKLKGALSESDFKKYMEALITLYDLTKVSLVVPNDLNLKFRQDNFPSFDFKTPEEKKKVEEVKE